jgi:hypothetical protein
MRKQSVETIAGMIEGLLTANQSIVKTNENKIRYYIVDAKRKDMAYLLDTATQLANDVLKHGFCSMSSLKKSFTRTSPIPDANESFEVERKKFKVGCFVYKNLNQCHLIVFGK